jgi:hypothetical protein
VLARTLRRAAVALVLMFGLGAVAFGTGRWLRERAAARTAASAIPVASASAPAASSSRLPTPAIVDSAPYPKSALRIAVAPPAPRAVERTFTLDLAPAMGVILSVDDGAPRHVSTGDSLPIDGKAHSLAFTCEVCSVVRREVAAGDRDETLKVVVPVKPATLFIEGDVDKTYQILQHPEVTVRAGTNVVSLGSAFERVTVEQIETKVSVPVRLEAGNSVRAAF